MLRLATPIVAALALALTSAEAVATPGGHVLSVRSAAPGYAQPTATPAPAPDAQPVPGPTPAPEPAPVGPQPYADPGQPGPEGPQPQPYVDPGAQGTVAPGAYPQPPRKRRKGLMIAGWTMFGASYLGTALIAAVVHDACNLGTRPNCKYAAGLTTIPLVGPFLAIPYLNTDAITPKIFMAFPALVQIAGLTMGIIGTVQFVRDGRQNQVVNMDGFRLTRQLRLNASPTPFFDGGSLSLRYRF